MTARCCHVIWQSLSCDICSQFTNETVQSQSLLDRRPERAILTVGTSLSYYTTKQKVIISNAIKVEISLKRINALMQFP